MVYDLFSKIGQWQSNVKYSINSTIKGVELMDEYKVFFREKLGNMVIISEEKNNKNGQTIFMIKDWTTNQNYRGIIDGSTFIIEPIESKRITSEDSIYYLKASDNRIDFVRIVNGILNIEILNTSLKLSEDIIIESKYYDSNATSYILEHNDCNAAMLINNNIFTLDVIPDIYLKSEEKNTKSTMILEINGIRYFENKDDLDYPTHGRNCTRHFTFLNNSGILDKLRTNSTKNYK